MGRKTLLERLRLGEAPPLLGRVAAEEGIDVGELAQAMLEGTAVLPCNGRRELESPRVVWGGSRTKVNANIGTSSDYAGIEDELVKLLAAVEAGPTRSWTSPRAAPSTG